MVVAATYAQIAQWGVVTLYVMDEGHAFEQRIPLYAPHVANGSIRVVLVG
jgi:hypothetical protein